MRGDVLTFKFSFPIGLLCWVDSFVLRKPARTQSAKTFIYDVMGKNIFNEENIKETVLKIDITNQPKGIYLVKIISGQDVVSKKIVIQ